MLESQMSTPQAIPPSSSSKKIGYLNGPQAAVDFTLTPL
jgi:hypothetical protein